MVFAVLLTDRRVGPHGLCAAGTGLEVQPLVRAAPLECVGQERGCVIVPAPHGRALHANSP